MADVVQELIFKRGAKAVLEAKLVGDKKPKYGEPIAEQQTDGSIKFKIGDGVHDYAALPYISGTNVEANPTTTGSDPELNSIKIGNTNYRIVSGGGGSVPTITQADIAHGVSHSEILDAIQNPKQGDIAIIKEAIDDLETPKRQYTAYVHTGSAWAAMDGNYDAENVYFADDLTYTAAIGVLPKPASSATLDAKGKNVKQVLSSILAKREQPNSAPPAVSLGGLQNSEDLEIGTNVSKSGTMTSSLSAGSYTYGPATGVVAQSWSSEIKYTAGQSGTIATGTTASTAYNYSFQLGDSTVSVNFKATATHNAGAIAKDNLGDDSNPVVQIAAGSKSKDSTASYTSYRKMFYGTRTDKTELDSAKIRALSGKKTATGAISVSIPTGAFRTIIAVPASRTVTSVKDVNGMGAEILSSFTQTTLDVEGANGFTAISYKIYYIDYAEAIGKANTYTVTIA